jgi:hypothetical protein
MKWRWLVAAGGRGARSRTPQSGNPLGRDRATGRRRTFPSRPVAIVRPAGGVGRAFLNPACRYAAVGGVPALVSQEPMEMRSVATGVYGSWAVR